MAEEPQNPPPAEQVLPVADPLPPPQPQPEEKAAEAEPAIIEEAEKAHEDKISVSVSFKEETNVVADLPEAQKKALDELKKLVQEALNKHELAAPKAPAPEPEKKKPQVAVVQEKKEIEVTEEEKKEVQVTLTEEKKEVQVTETEEKKEVEVTEEKKEVEVTEEKKEVEVTEEKKEVEGTEEKKEGEVTEEKKEAEEVEIWGIPLLADERSDVILLKFLRARDFKVKDALTMIKNTVRWRKEFGIDGLVAEDLGSDWDKVVFNHGQDKQGHPVCYNVFGEFENKELYNKTFSDEEKRNKFIRWRIQLLEKSVRSLDFSPTAISTIVQVNDLKNSPGLGKRDLRQATNQALQLLQDNYPEFVAKQIFINVPWWYLAFSRMISPFLTQRTKSKFLFAGPSKSAETLFKYIAPELVPLQYGGLSREAEQEFTAADAVTEVTIKPTSKHAVVFPVSEKSHLVWEIRVVGWEVNYGAEFVPSAEDGYTVIVQKSRKIASTDETVITNGFKIGEAGKVVLTIDNQTSKKKKLLYRSKTKATAE
ncbi:patellin-3 [Cajanus cajan]|uniref:patellin-3 n=1 Tax=Cajanus cajan TaxID=3821 RepID=UPI00098D8311|nr:patellin-3 [Cajanus cajan]